MNTPKSISKHFSEKVDLGKGRPSIPGMGGMSEDAPASKSYPNLHIEVPPDCNCGVGDEGHALIKYHVKGASEDEGDGKEGGKKTKRLEMAVHHISFPGDDESEENDDNNVQDGRLSASMEKLMKSRG